MKDKMVVNKEIYVKIEKIKEIVSTLENINNLKVEIKDLFKEIDYDSEIEKKLLENWEDYLEEINVKIEYITN